MRKQAESDKKAQLVQMGIEMKNILAMAEETDDPVEKRALMKRAKSLCKQMDEVKKSVAASAAASAGIVKRTALEDAKDQATVQQLLPDSVATERLEQIAEVSARGHFH